MLGTPIWKIHSRERGWISSVNSELRRCTLHSLCGGSKPQHLARLQTPCVPLPLPQTHTPPRLPEHYLGCSHQVVVTCVADRVKHPRRGLTWVGRGGGRELQSATVSPDRSEDGGVNEKKPPLPVTYDKGWWLNPLLYVHCHLLLRNEQR